MVPQAGRKEQLCAPFRHPPAEQQSLQTPAKQLACITHLVPGASGYPAEQERSAKSMNSISLSASASLPGLGGEGKQPQTCLADGDGRAQLRWLLLPVNLSVNLLGWPTGLCTLSRKDQLPLRVSLYRTAWETADW